MIDIKFLRANPDVVKENIKKKFQDSKIELVDKVIELDEQYRKTKVECDNLRNQRKVKSKEIGGFMAKGMKDEAEAAKAEVAELGTKLTEMEELEVKLEADIREIMLTAGRTGNAVLFDEFHHLFLRPCIYCFCQSNALFCAEIFNHLISTKTFMTLFTIHQGI